VRQLMVLLGACEVALGIVWIKGRVPARRRPPVPGRPSGQDPAGALLVGGLLVVVGALTLWLALGR